MEYFDAAHGKGVLFAFHGSSTEETKHTFVLQGLDPDRLYQLTFQDHSSQGQSMSGSELMTQGVQVPLPVPASSELIFLDAISK